MPQETDVLPVNYAELSINKLLARLRHTLVKSTPLAVAELANHLPAENQTEFRMPEDPAHIEVIVASSDKNRFFRITYFTQPTEFPEKEAFFTQQPNKIIVSEGKFWSSGQTNPPATTWENWQALLSEKGRHVWERIVKKAEKIEVRVFTPSKTSIYQNNKLVSGDPSILPQAAAVLDHAFQTSLSQLRSLDNIEKIAWGTIVEPEKPEPPEGGGHRVHQAEKKLIPIPITIPF